VGLNEAMPATVLPPPSSVRAGAVVLVHGAWVGDWCWGPLLPVLESSGRPVHAVALTGQGSRRRQTSPDIDLGVHVDDVCDLVEVLDLTDIVLVGHSYGGRVITNAYGRLADRIARLVYIDAHAPLAPDTGHSPERVRLAEEHGGYLPFDQTYAPDPAVVGDDGVAWFMERLVLQPFATLSSSFAADLPPDLPKAFLACTGYGNSRFTRYAAAASAADDWEYYEIASDHWPMFSHVGDVAAIILGASTR